MTFALAEFIRIISSLTSVTALLAITVLQAFLMPLDNQISLPHFLNKLFET
jgi:hypothetical protein